MTSGYAKARRELADQRDGSGDASMVPCPRCQSPAMRETLSLYGARCFACYRDYCAEPRLRVDIGNKRVSPRDWAHALKRRHDHGERLTPAQVTAYTAALRMGAASHDD